MKEYITLKLTYDEFVKIKILIAEKIVESKKNDDIENLNYYNNLATVLNVIERYEG